MHNILDNPSTAICKAGTQAGSDVEHSDYIIEVSLAGQEAIIILISITRSCGRRSSRDYYHVTTERE